MTAAIQTIWCELLVHSLADAGITSCVISPGSRSTPLVAALAAESGLELVTIIDERAAAFFALGAARACGRPVVLVCTSGTAAAHYLPAIIEASLASVPLIAITADRPPELHGCGASQTIDQIDLYGRFVRGAFDLGAPVGSEVALKALRRKMIQAVTLTLGPHAGPIHVEVPLRKPLEPAAPSTDDERTLARFATSLRGRVAIAPPRLGADPSVIADLVEAIGREPDGVIVAGAMPATFAQSREALFDLARRAGYPILGEAGSQVRFCHQPGGITAIAHADLIPIAHRPHPRVLIQLGAEPVAASWPAWLARIDDHATRRWVLAGTTWIDPTSSANTVILGDVGGVITWVVDALAARAVDRSAASSSTPDGAAQRVRSAAWRVTWHDLDDCAHDAFERANARLPRGEAALVASAIAAVPAGGIVQIGNSLPIRVIDHACRAGGDLVVLTQRGAAGIDGLVASAAGATRAGKPVLLVLGDVSFAHDLGGLLAARSVTAPLAILVVDNGGGQIFTGLPVARAGLAETFERHWLTPPAIDPAAVATALGVRAITAASPAAAATAIADALATTGVTVVHAPVSATGAHDVRTTALEMFTNRADPTALRHKGLS